MTILLTMLTMHFILLCDIRKCLLPFRLIFSPSLSPLSYAIAHSINKFCTLFAFNVHILFACLMKGLNFKNNHLLFDVAKQPLMYFIITFILGWSISSWMHLHMNLIIFLNSLSFSLFEMMPPKVPFLFLSRRIELVLDKCLKVLLNFHIVNGQFIVLFYLTFN